MATAHVSATAGRPNHGPRLRLVTALPAAIALGGAAGLLVFYLGVITLAQGWDHAGDQLREDLWFIAPMTAGFGVQLGLFARLRQMHGAARGGTAVTAGSTGAGTTAMLACCAHHLTDLLPVLGLSGAAVFLNDWKTPIALAALVMTAAGIAYMAVRLRQAWRIGLPHVTGGAAYGQPGKRRVKCSKL